MMLSASEVMARRLVPEEPLTAMYRESLSILTRNAGPAELGDYLEFGVYNGTSLSCMYALVRELGYDNMRFFDCDSFEGLPRDPNKKAETLLRQHPIERASVIMVDCDVYSSAVQSLRFAGPHIRDEAAIIFDDRFSAGLADRNMGEKRAFQEFLAEHPFFDCAEMGGYNANSLMFHVRRRRSTSRPEGPRRSPSDG